LSNAINIPNLITILRILLVPLTVWLMMSGQFMVAFFAFVVAGVSDGLDGYLARRFDWRTELGAYLDPLADKALLVSIYIVLGALQLIPLWLVILVATRDILIVSAVLLARVMQTPMTMRPLWISKVNTVFQIVFAGFLLFFLGFGWGTTPLIVPGAAVVTLTTLASLAFYMRDWLRHMSQPNRSETRS
jgi:cardiolipin synthase (CMP-forming)